MHVSRTTEPTDRRRPGRVRRSPTPAESRPPSMLLGASLLAGNANVIMQLAHPAVGHGVVESAVTSGQLSRHPVKRTRTTLTYLAVSTMGSAEERHAFRRAVNRQHARVRSGESSPVRYNAFDHDLQLWVAACLYKGIEHTREAFGMPLTGAHAEAVYRHAARLGSTLQVPEDRWPEDRDAFERYWKQGVERISLDETVRAHLLHLTGLGFLPVPLRRVFGPANRFLTTGFLPQRFREELGLAWGPRQQRRFDRLTAAVGAVVRNSPRRVQEFPHNVLLRDVRRRIRTGKPLV